MAKGFSDTTNDNDITFDNYSYLSNNSNWTTIDGNITYGETIVMDADSSMINKLQFNKIKCNYIKLQIHLSADDKSLSTDNYHSVYGIFEIDFTNKKGEKAKKIFEYYPKYEFEDTYIDDYTTIKIDDSASIDSISVTIGNSESVPINITETGLYISKVVDEAAIKDAIKTDEDIRNTIDDIISDYISTSDLIIPLINDISEMNSKPDGAIARCSWIEGVGV